MTDTLLDARGAKIKAGDTVIYGYSVGSSVAIAEGVVVGESHRLDKGYPETMREVLGDEFVPYTCACGDLWPCMKPSASLTASGRVRVRIIRRSHGGGEKPVVDVAPNRLVVLKRAFRT